MLEHEGVAAFQVIFNLFRQNLVDELFPHADAAGVGILARVPLASGLLTGKFTRESSFAADDHRSYHRTGDAFNVGETFARVPFEPDVSSRMTSTGSETVEARWRLRLCAGYSTTRR